MKNMKNLMFAILLLLIMLLGMVVTYIFLQSKETKICYPHTCCEYIFTVDGTDSINKYTIYDQYHNVVALNILQNQLDSVINLDNQ